MMGRIWSWEEIRLYIGKFLGVHKADVLDLDGELILGKELLQEVESVEFVPVGKLYTYKEP